MTRKQRRSSLHSPSTSPAPDPTPTPSLPPWLPYLALAILTILTLSPSLHGAYLWDDDQWLTQNPNIILPGRFWLIWTSPASSPHYYPLVFTSFWLEHHFFGLGSTGPDGLLRGTIYHLDNLLLHTTASLLLFHILRKLKLPGAALGAWLAAAIFAIHPINVESVAWVAERKNTLCAAFFFASLLYTLKAFRLIDTDWPKTTKLNRRHYFLALALFLAAMLSKPAALFLPPAILVLLWWKNARISRRDILLTLPFFTIAIAFSAVTASVELGAVGAMGPEWQFSPLQRILIAGADLWFYLGKILFPYPVMQIYPRFNIIAGQPITNPLYYAAPIAFFILLIALFLLRNRITRGPLVAMLLFAGGVFPTLGFINFYTMLYTFVADHYQYLACPPIIVLAVEILLWLTRRLSALSPSPEVAARRFRRAAGTLAAAILLSLGLLSIGIAGRYTEPLALWTFNAEHNPTSFAVYNQIADACLAMKPPDTQAAMSALQKSLQFGPNDWRAHHAMAVCLLNQDKTEEAAGHLATAESLMPASFRDGRAAFYADPDRITAAMDAGGLNRSAATYGPDFLLAASYRKRGLIDKAIEHYKADLAQYPGNPEAWRYLGDCYTEKENLAEAAQSYQTAVKIYPRYAEAWFSLFGVLLNSGHDTEAAKALTTALQLDPSLENRLKAMVRSLSTTASRPGGGH